jgi:hypothetical protein
MGIELKKVVGFASPTGPLYQPDCHGWKKKLCLYCSQEFASSKKFPLENEATTRLNSPNTTLGLAQRRFSVTFAKQFATPVAD